MTANVTRYWMLLDGQRKARRDEKYVEQQYAEHRGKHGSSAAEFDRDQQHGEQEEHDDIGQVETAEQGRGEQGRADAGQNGQQHALPGPETLRGMNPQTAFAFHDAFPFDDTFSVCHAP
jgi:hypothetical protein